MVIVAAVDRSDRTDDVIREAEALAQVFDEPIHAIHVLTTSAFVELGRTSAEAGDSIDMDEVLGVATDIAADATVDLDVPHETVGLMGDPASEVVDYAAEHDASYIVVAGRKRRPTGKVIFGSVAQSILLNAECPVVSIIKQSGA